MIEKIEYGLPQVYAFEVDSNGDAQSDSLTVSGYDEDTRVVTLSGAVTVASVGKYVVFHETGENNYGFGQLKTTTTIELHEDSKDYFINTSPATSLKVYRGMGAASFESCEVANNPSDIQYKGQYAYSRQSAYTDFDTTFTLTDVVFTPEFSELINGFTSEDFSGGHVQALRDYDVASDKEVRPNNITLIALKRRVEDDDKWEEFYMPNIRTGDLEVPTERDSYATNTYSFICQTKNRANEDVMDYVTEI